MAIWTVSAWVEPRPTGCCKGRGRSPHDEAERKVPDSPLLDDFLYVGAEIGVSNWLAEYFVQHYRRMIFGANEGLLVGYFFGAPASGPRL